MTRVLLHSCREITRSSGGISCASKNFDWRSRKVVWIGVFVFLGAAGLPGSFFLFFFAPQKSDGWKHGISNSPWKVSIMEERWSWNKQVSVQLCADHREGEEDASRRTAAERLSLRWGHGVPSSCAWLRNMSEIRTSVSLIYPSPR